MVERKFLGGVQLRVGPYVVGVIGLLQTLADGIKLLTKSVGSTFILMGGSIYLICIVIFAVSVNIMTGLRLIVIGAY